ncbi:hypothetical protein TruAng_004900 [Truncatella angustata]|nr:hypothetical protein TruAng_004900 [Truncatella angustata]
MSFAPSGTGPLASNSNQYSITQHPLEAIATGIMGVGHSETRLPRTTHMMGANEGPADVAAKISGVIQGGIRNDDAPYFTNNEGIPWPDASHSKTIGGIPVASDVYLFHSGIVHPCGSGAFGYFEVTKNVSDLTKANFLQKVGEKTPVFTRFSTVTLGREYPDQARNPRGFAIKFYTKEGNYDIVGLNFPVFFCRDPIQGPDVIRSQWRSHRNFLLDNNSLFDLLANTPEANHAGLMFFSDHGTPVGWRHNNGYGCHTFRWVNAQNEFVYIKYHFMAKHGTKQFAYDEAIRTMGEDPDYSKRDLWDTIEAGETPEWTAYVQVMQPQDACPQTLGFDPFDVTKVWPRDRFPMQEFGRLVLNKNPENFHRDVEQAAFSPGSMVPGIGDSPDALLQFRMFFYRDAQYHRMGSTNLHQIPVNCPFMAQSYSSINFDGNMRSDANHAGNPQYNPNSQTYKFRPDTAEAPMQVSDSIMSRKSHYWHEGKDNDYDQARELWARVMSVKEKTNTCYNTGKFLNLCNVPLIQKKYLAQIYRIAPEYSQGVYEQLKKDFDFTEVVELSRGCEKWYKEEKFSPTGEMLTGYAPQVPVYNV